MWFSTTGMAAGRTARSRRRRWRAATMATALALTGVLYTARPAQACSILDPLCWVEEALDAFKDLLVGVTHLVVDVVTLDPGEFFDDLTDIGEDLIFCDGLGIPQLTYGEFLAYQLGGATAEALFNDCDASQAIPDEVRAKLETYFRSDFSTVQIHTNCDFPLERKAITFGENIYFKSGWYEPTNCGTETHPCACKDGFNNLKFSVLAHELVHVLQYRREGFKDFICKYSLECGVGGVFDAACPFEQQAYVYQALVLEDMRRDGDGIFTCPLGECDDEVGEWTLQDVEAHSCTAEVALCGIAVGEDAPNYCAANDNCPDVTNPDQADSDGDGRGDACDVCDGALPPFEDLDGDCVVDTADNCACPPDEVALLTDCDASNDPYASPPPDGCFRQTSCTLYANPTQADLDADGMGDLCDPDDDGDGVDDIADNCPRVVNPDQANYDGDGSGNVCDDSDAVLEIRRARVLVNRSSAQRPNGEVVVRGDIVLESPADTVDAAQGIAFRVTDGGLLDVSFEWSAAQCTIAQGILTCFTPVGVLTVDNRPISAMPARLPFVVNVIGQNIQGPILPSLSIRMINSPPVPTTGVDRVGTIDDCEIERRGMSCVAS